MPFSRYLRRAPKEHLEEQSDLIAKGQIDSESDLPVTIDDAEDVVYLDFSSRRSSTAFVSVGGMLC